MAKKPENEKSSDVPADEAALSDDARRSLIRDHLSEVARLAAEITPEPPTGNAFDHIETIQPGGDMQTARDTPQMKRALTQIDAAVIGLTTVESIFAGVTYIAGRLGLPA